ncbi:MAG: chemotaxis protein CheA [Candidatus Cloacimonadota bacterium]|nr:MAG: chemotaxis protein CheA [Candidatus Cloacimonadota bacterium]
MINQDSEMLQMFLEEAQEHLANLEPGLLELEQNKEAPDQELINEIFRAVHSLKGAAGFFGFEAITGLSHAMENLLSLVRDGKLKPNSEMITALLDGTDRLNLMIKDIDNSEDVDYEDNLKLLNSLIDGKSSSQTVRLEYSEIDSLPDKIAKEFDIDIDDLKNAVVKGHFLYAVKAFTGKDMKAKGKNPVNYLKDIDKLGNLLGSYSDFSEVGSLDTLKESEIAFVFLFSSVLEPDLIALGLDVEEYQVEELKFPEFQKQNESEPEDSVVEEKKKKNESEIETKADNQVAEQVALFEKNIEKKESNKTDSGTSGVTTKESLRVHVDLLNDLMTLAGELVLARNQLLRMASDSAKKIPGLQNVLQDIDLTTTMLQGKIMETRMQPIGMVFNKFPRVIRDMQRKLGKKINLEMSGNEVDLDKTIIENLSDPLTHLIRNAADHGIESPEERKKAGKREQGTVWLKAYHEGGKVNIDVIDDGKGLDPEKLIGKAIEKGIITEADALRMDEKSIHNLIFAPGFSTAKEVTDVSGRGVGMDVVRTNIEKIGGNITIDSALGKGTVFNLKLPLTLAIIPSLIVTVKEMNFALSQVALKRIVRIRADRGAGDNNQLKIEMVNSSPVLRLKNKLLPIIYLDKVLNLNRDDEEPRKMIRVLVLQHDEHEFGLVVDEIFDSEEIVVKSIPRFFKNSLAYSGTTIMGDGTVALILDVSGIAAKSKLNFTAVKEKRKKTENEIADEANLEKQNLLLFENAENEQFALNLDLIKRIEEISTDKIECVGEKEYIEHENKSLRVIRMEQYLPVRSPKSESEHLYVIIPKLIESPMGIIAHKIIDSITVSTSIDTDNIQARGLIGSSLIDNNIVLFPDIYELVDMAEPEKSFANKNTQNQKINILIVEDTPFFRTVEKQYLLSAGYNVDTAIDGLDGLKKAKSKKYDLFIVDLVMPRLDGFEFVKSIRQEEGLTSVPAIAVTTLTNEESRKKAIEAGFNAYEVKIRKEKLLAVIKYILNERNNN